MIEDKLIEILGKSLFNACVFVSAVTMAATGLGFALVLMERLARKWW